LELAANLTKQVWCGDDTMHKQLSSFFTQIHKHTNAQTRRQARKHTRRRTQIHMRTSTSMVHGLWTFSTVSIWAALTRSTFDFIENFDVFMENFDVFMGADYFALRQADEIAEKLRAGDEDSEEESLKGEFGVMEKVEGGLDEIGSSSEEEWCRLMRKGRGDEFRGGEKDKAIKHERCDIYGHS